VRLRASPSLRGPLRSAGGGFAGAGFGFITTPVFQRQNTSIPNQRAADAPATRGAATDRRRPRRAQAHRLPLRRGLLVAIAERDIALITNFHTAAPRRSAATALLAAVVLAGCTAPGMQMNVAATRSATPADVRARADVFPIDVPTLERLRQLGANSGTAMPRPAVFRGTDEPWQYLVGPQDVLRITVFEHPELTNPSGTANELSGRVVNSDGKVFFPYIGPVQAAGRTVQEIRQTIQEGLTRVIKNPQVDVSVLQFRSQRVVVAGEVRTPGTQPITDVPPTLSEIISAAGGVGPEADLSSVTVTRGGTSARVDLYAYFYGGDSRQNLRLLPGDVVHVPDRRFNKVFVLGEVGRPNSIVMPRGRLTLAEALADAGGVNPFSANAGQIYVIRDGGQKAQIYHLNASSPDALVLADRFDLRQRDVVFVDAAPVVRWARVVNNILPTADFLRESLNDLSPSLPR
jgi:polysaccharide biosynthesis/export protein